MSFAKVRLLQASFATGIAEQIQGTPVSAIRQAIGVATAPATPASEKSLVWIEMRDVAHLELYTNEWERKLTFKSSRHHRGDELAS
ncbi:hypothetical protein [Ochrobactrum sp. BTU1]|uniref:hypothetical protein n=1 Tax=Ochrobactrum sp. BTU1 TaxID=2840456 RepID=UPI001C03AD11|nr:hypothetical protein KMS41_27325 [Ochrobactrum sp. BTU1]